MAAATLLSVSALAPVRASAADPTIAAAGDIACDPSVSGFNDGLGTVTRCRQKYTSDLLVNAGLSAVLPLGDVQYECSGYAAFAASYAPTWGRLLSISWPVTGNHEYLTTGGTGCDASNAGAAGYFKYFGAAAGDPSKGYYSFDIGAWHLVALNSQCQQAGGCKADTDQGKWLKADLEAHPNRCTLAYMHVPRFSSGGHAKAIVQPLWDALYAAGADVVLSGHDHIYERFAPMTPAGVLDLAHGIRQFVVGTGGATHTSFTTSAPNSEIRDANTFGVLMLTLHPSSYSWRFEPEAGQAFTDVGSQNCHSAQSSTADTGLPAIQQATSAPIERSKTAPPDQSTPSPVLPAPANTSGPKAEVSSSPVWLDRRGYVAIKVKCPSTEPTACTGTLTLRTASRVRISARKRFVTLGGATFRARKGTTVTVNLKLSPKSRELVRRLKRVKVRVTALVRNPANEIGTTTKTLTLRSASQKRARGAR